MGQRGFFDMSRRLESISAKGDPLELISANIPFESLRAEIEEVTRLKPGDRKSNAGRKPYDAVLMFKILVVQTLYNLSDDQLEYLIRDRLSFMRFLGWALRTLYLMRPRSGCSARRLRVPGSLKSCLPPSTTTLRPKATSRAAARSSTPRS